MFGTIHNLVNNRFSQATTDMGMKEGMLRRRAEQMLGPRPTGPTTDMGMQRGLDMRAMMDKIRNQTGLTPHIKINGMDMMPKLPSYRSAIHEGLTSKYQGATDVARIPSAYSSTSPMPQANKVIAPMPTPQ